MAEREDPTGYRIEPEGKQWAAYRLTDHSLVGRYKTRENALAAIDQDRDDPEEPR